MSVTVDPPVPSFARSRVERLIASVRIALAAAGLFGVLLEPEATRFPLVTDWLYAGYLLYALVLAAIMWRRDSTGRLPLILHATDIVIASVLTCLTTGTSSPFYVYFVFALFSAALRWNWQATLRTAAVVFPLFLVLGAYLNTTQGAAGFDANKFVSRSAYLLVVTVVLVFLGQHEARLREEIRRLARWPLPAGQDWTDNVRCILQYAAGIVGARDAAVIWSEDDEPWRYLVFAQPDAARIERHPPATFDPIVPADLTDDTFLWPTPGEPASVIRVSRAGRMAVRGGSPVHRDLLPRLGTDPIASAAFRAGQLSGRVFFLGLPEPTADLLPLVELVGREIGASLDRLQTDRRSRDLAIVEERIRVARDLHDGILQALTGIRLELQHVAANDRRGSPALPAADSRLVDLETAIATEQRELRRLIDDLRPSPVVREESPLTERLQALRSRIALEWRIPVSITVSPPDLTVPSSCERNLPFMVHEGIVNALKHGQPSRVVVTISAEGDELRVTVEDDGRGFAFTGIRNHAALAESNAGPRSLRERVTSLGGRIDIESTALGSRVELLIPLRTVHA
ncbi:MAG TPA: histidine kinase [Vicinamibacterales bacterium]|nr:histidine kinase [Vicinamibacterales bacterium]